MVISVISKTMNMFLEMLLFSLFTAVTLQALLLVKVENICAAKVPNLSTLLIYIEGQQGCI